MSQKHANSAALLAATTGTGIAVGTNVDIAGVYICSAATTVTIVVGTATQIITATTIDYYPPIAVATGPVTATSSGGSFYIAYVPR